MPRNEKCKCRAMSNIRKHTSSKVRLAEFYAGTMRLKNTRGQNFTCFQNNVIDNFKAMGDETLNQELPPTHTHKHTYVYALTDLKM